jgi:TonB family protein
MTSKEGCGLEMFTRVATAATMIAIVLCASSQSLDAQSAPTLALVDVPIPIYPPIAVYAAISGDVHVTVDVRRDGTVASTTVARVEGFNRESDAKFLEQHVLDAARQARFRCEQCGDTTTPYSLVFAFRVASRVGRAARDLHPEVVSISPSRSRILIVAELGPPNGPIAERAPRPRAARCLWLWRCKKYTEPDIGEPEVIAIETTSPAYPAEARAARASGEIEVKVAVKRNGKVSSIAMGRTRNLVNSTQAVESAFQRAAVEAARETTFLCRRCRQGTLPYTFVYTFRFDGVLARLDLGYAASGHTSSPSESRLVVAADVPMLDAALGVRTDALPSACHLTPAQPAAGEVAVTGNPWAGDDPAVKSFIRARIVQRPGSDPPTRYELQLAEGVHQTYVAWYIDGNRETTAVYGLLFGDPNDARAFMELAAETGSTTFLLHRQIVVAVRGGSACADGLAALLKDRAAMTEPFPGQPSPLPSAARRGRADVKTAAWAVRAVTALASGRANDVLDQTLHGLTHYRVFPGQGR